MVNSLNLDYFVNSAREVQRKFNNRHSFDNPRPVAEATVAQAMASLDRHDGWFREVGVQLANLGCRVIDSVEVPGLGSFWTPEGVKQTLQTTKNTEVIKEIFLGLTEQMKKINAFITALAALPDCEDNASMRSDILSGTSVNLHTKDGYVFKQSIDQGYKKEQPGIGIKLRDISEPESMQIAGKGTWAKYAQVAGNNNPGAWKAGSKISTIALSKASADSQSHDQKGTMLFEYGEHHDGTSAVKVQDLDSIKVDFLQGKAIEPIVHALHRDEEPLFRRAA